MTNYTTIGLSSLKSIFVAIGVLAISVLIAVLSGTAQWEDILLLTQKDITHFGLFIKIAASVTILGWIYVWVSKPMEVKFQPDTVDRIPNGKLLARAVRSRRSGKIPPPFPTGWYKIADSHELQVGQVKYIEFFNTHLALFRGENGKAAILDAYCPHLGANIAVEGRVVGNCIECPFHGWQFREDGKCVSIPYLDKVPEVARTKSWPVKEINSMILMYFDALGRLDEQQQTWQPPEVEQIKSGFVFHGSFENYVEAHIQEIPENGSDVAHLGVLHVPFMLRWLPFITHRWTANWTAGEAPTEHISNIDLTQCMLFFGKEIPYTHVTTRINQIGPGLVHLEINTSIGQLVIIEAVTPMHPLFQRVSHVVFGKNNLIQRLHAKVVLTTFSEQFNRDVVMWNNKTYVNKPMIVKNDGNILGFRRWYSKFYPDPEELKKYQQEHPDLTW